MMDIDLGPVVAFIFVVLIVIPTLLGLLIGIGTSYLLMRKRPISKIKKMMIILFVGILLAVLFSVATVKFSEWQTGNENKKFNTKEKQYIELNLSNFKIERASFSNYAYQIEISVPRTERYRVMVYLFQNDKQISLLSKWKDGIDLLKGVNTINIDIQGKNINIPLPVDLAITIQSADDSYALRNTRKSLVVTNPGEIEKQEGVIYYSPSVATDNGECPVFNYLNWLPCMSNNLLHIE